MEAEQFDLPRPNLAVGDGYGGGGEKMPAAGVSTASKRSRQLSASPPMTMKLAAALGLCEGDGDRGLEHLWN
jgi:hypothetical protein